MIKNYLKTAWRNLTKNKFYTVINMTGLAIGLSVGIMVLLWVQNELSYDSFHKNAADIYKVNSHIGKGTSAQVWAGAPAPLAVFCKQSIPEVANVARIQQRYEEITFANGSDKFKETSTAFVDPSFFSIFSFPLLQGSTTNPFSDDHSIIITASTAKKYFNTEQAVGKVLVSDTENFVVTGVLKDFPQNSTINYDILFPMDLYAHHFGGNGSWKTIDEDLGDFQYSIFLQVNRGVLPDVVSKKISRLYVDKRKDEPNIKDDYFSLQSMSSLHLVAPDGNKGALKTVRMFLLIGILILCIACINYVNLSTARSILRSKEVSMRKIIGAARLQLFFQFIIESALLFLFAFILSIVIIYLLLPLYNQISGRHLVFSLADSNVWLVVTYTIVGSLAMSAIYPALQLSAFKPIQALRGKLSLGIGKATFRKALVITQFVFSVGLIIATIVISKQLRYIREKDLGFSKEYVFSFWLNGQAHDHFDAVRNDLLKAPGILDVSSADNTIAGANSTTGDTYWEGKEADRMFLIHPNGIDKDLIPMLKMKMAMGTNFRGTPGDSANVILNETAIRQAGIKNPIGKYFTLWTTKATIIGVVKDFNYASLKTAVEPAIFYYSPKGWRIFVKTTGTDAQKAIVSAQRIWRQYNAESPFEYAFLDDDFNQMYADDQRTGTLFNLFAIVAIVISCLGLFGLATYTAQVKTREIGIRKVLGASAITITRLLAREFIVLVLAAFVIATPLAWFFMNKWLRDFVYRIHIDGWIFIMTGLLALAIAFVTVGFQAVKAAIANPVKSLRAE